MKRFYLAALAALAIALPAHAVTLNSRGQVAAGVGNGIVSIDGIAIASPAGGAEWFEDPSTVVYQNCSGGVCRLETYNWESRVYTTVAERGASHLSAGGGVWAAWLAGYGVFTSTGLHFPEAGLGPVGPDGAIAIKPLYNSFGPWEVLEKDGSRWKLTDGDALDIQLLGAGRAIWREGSAVRVANLPPISILPGGAWWVRGAVINDKLWVLYQSDHAAGRLVLHPHDSFEGYIVAGDTATFRPSIREINGLARVAWAIREGEAPGETRVADVDLRAPRVNLLGTPPVVTPPAEPKPEPPPAQLTLIAPKRQSVVADVIRDHPEIDSCDEVARGAIVDWAAQRLNAVQGLNVARWGRKSRGRPQADGTAVRPNTDALTFLRPDGLFEIYDAISGGKPCGASWHGYGPFKPGENGYWAPPQLPAEGGTPEPPPVPPTPTPTPCPPAPPVDQTELNALRLEVTSLAARLNALQDELKRVTAERDELRSRPEPSCEAKVPGFLKLFGVKIGCTVVQRYE